MDKPIRQLTLTVLAGLGCRPVVSFTHLGMVPVAMGSFGIYQLLIVLGIALLLFGSSRLPQLARSFGQSINEFKKGIKEIDDQSDESAGDNNN